MPVTNSPIVLGRQALTTLLSILVLGLSVHAIAKPPFEVVGYLPDYEYTGPIGSEGAIDLTNNTAFPWDKITQLHVGFMIPNGSGGLVEVPGSTQRVNTALYGHQNSTRVILTIGGATDGTSNASLRSKWEANTASGAMINTFVANIISQLTTNNYDGVDIDWEFPTSADQTQFMNFMAALSAAVHGQTSSCGGCVFEGKPKQLSFFISTGYDICGVNWGSIASDVDYGIYGGYDFNPTGFNGPLSDNTVPTYTDCRGVSGRYSCVTDTVETLTNGLHAGYYFPKSKLILACPLYSQQPQSSNGTAILPILRYGTHIKYQSPQEEDEWSYNGLDHWVETSQSYCQKVNYAIGSGMAGIGVWDIGLAYPASDPEVAPIWQVIGGLASCDNSIPTPTPGPPPNLPAPYIIDTFEKTASEPTNLWGGKWSANNGYCSGSCSPASTASTPAFPSPGAPGSPWGTNACLTETLNFNSSNMQPYLSTTLAPSGNKDLTPYNRLDFFFKGTPGLYQVNISTTQTAACGDYGMLFNVTNSGWNHYQFYFIDFSQPTWASCHPNFLQALKAATLINFMAANTGSYTFSLDDVEVYTDSVTPTITPVPATYLLDTFEDGNLINNWGGAWSSWAPTGSSISTVNPLNPGYPFSLYGYMYSGLVTGTNSSPTNVGTVSTFLDAAQTTVSLSSYNYIDFYVQASSTAATYGVQMSDGSTYWAGTTFTVPADGAWHLVSVPFSALGGLKPASVKSVSWYSNAAGAYSLALDDIWFENRPPTPTPSMTASDTPLPSATVSATPSVTDTPSPSATATASPSASPTPSPSATATASPSASLTPSPSVTDSVTPTPSPTVTTTVSPSDSPSITVTDTPPPPGSTATSTSTVSPTWSASASSTLTPSASPSASPTSTSTPTATLAAGTATASITASLTASASPSASPSGTVTASPSSSATPNVAFSATGTPTGTPSLTVTASPTASPAQTATASPTASPIPTATASATPSPALTATPSFSPSPVLSPTPTATIPAGGGGGGTLQILDGGALPNPMLGHGPGAGGASAGSIAVKLDGPADLIQLSLYSPALVRVDKGDARLTVAGAFQAGWANRVPLPLDLMMGLPSGAYYYRIVVRRGSLKGLKPFIGKLVWLK